MIGEHRIITYGLTNEENSIILKNIPAHDYKVMNTECATDIIAFSASAVLINAAKLSNNDYNMIIDYYTEINGCTYETVIWIGTPVPQGALKKQFKCYESFDMIENNLKYILLSAHSKSQKAASFSKKLADGIKILSFIRNRPGITTRELSETMELSQRTIQRYIRLTYLIPELLDLVDSKRIALGPAVELSYLSENNQYVVENIFTFDEVTPSLSQAIRLKKLQQEELLTEEKIEEIMQEEKPNQKEFIKIHNEKIEKYIPNKVKESGKVEDFIIKCVKEYLRNNKK